MQTAKLKVWSTGEGTENALDITENFAKDIGLNGTNARRLRLLAEETLAMVHSIVEEFEANFWLEEKASKCTLHLTADTLMNVDKKRRLIDASTDKKNAAAVGIMGRIRDMLEVGFCGGVSPYMSASGIMTMQSDVCMWSLDKYRRDIENAPDDDPKIAAALDELEKSIVANIADDIRVAVRGNKIELVIEKTFRDGAEIHIKETLHK